MSCENPLTVNCSSGEDSCILGHFHMEMVAEGIKVCYRACPVAGNLQKVARVYLLRDQLTKSSPGIFAKGPTYKK